MARVSIIKYEGDNSTFIWKHPCEDFNNRTQLIVHESQEAIFFMNGQALDRFGPGRYTLETQNLPVLRSVISSTTGKKTPFHCEVYFINKTEQMSVRWGTDSKVQYIEPTYKFPISIGASGEMALSVADPRKLLVKLVGTEKELNRETLTDYFRAILMKKVKPYIAQAMRNNAINIFETDEYLEVFSKDIEDKLVSDFAEYGITLNHFYVTTILKPDGEEQYERFKDIFFRSYAEIAEAKLKQEAELIYAETEAQKILINADAMANKRILEGYTYQEERGFAVAQDAVNNEATGQLANIGIGLGVASGIGGNLGSIVSNAINAAIVGAEAVEDEAEEIVEEAAEEVAEEVAEEATEEVAEEAVEEAAEEAVEEVVEEAAEEAPATNGICPVCGTVAAEGTNYCAICGEKL